MLSQMKFKRRKKMKKKTVRAAFLGIANDYGHLLYKEVEE